MSDDQALQKALAQFNEGLRLQREEDRARRAIEKAERRKDQAAGKLKELQADTRADAETKATAEQEYKAALADLARLRAGEAEPDQPEAEPDQPEAEPDESREAGTEQAEEPAG